jgi:hypothetical protein
VDRDRDSNLELVVAVLNVTVRQVRIDCKNLNALHVVKFVNDACNITVCVTHESSCNCRR